MVSSVDDISIKDQQEIYERATSYIIDKLNKTLQDSLRNNPFYQLSLENTLYRLAGNSNHEELCEYE